MNLTRVIRSVLVVLLLISCCLLYYSCGVQSQVVLDGSKEFRYVRPEWFGAVNDGTTDCSDALQKMFDYMSKHDIYECRFSSCHFEKGEYYLISRTVRINRPVKIKGRRAYISSRSIIHNGTDPNKWYYNTDGVALDFTGQRGQNAKVTDISFNIKVHAKPLFFNNIENVYVHDCYLSTYTNDELVINQGVKPHWYAVQCYDFENAVFKNIHIDQPAEGKTYNSADGIHLSGRCHDIEINHVYGQAGDDFIALNSNECNAGDIYNITIKNCIIGKDIPSFSGIRVYGCTRLSDLPNTPQLKIYNVNINNCYINTSLAPCVYFTNNNVFREEDKASYKLNISDFTIKNCKLSYHAVKNKNMSAIWMVGAELNNLQLDKLTYVGDNKEEIPLLILERSNELNKVDIKRSHHNINGKGSEKMAIRMGVIEYGRK